MDNVCHTLAGAALAQAGLKKTTALAGATLMMASNLPDLDVLVFATDIPSVAFRRGWTHGVLAQALLPAALGALVWAAGRRRANVRLGPLIALSYLGVLAHVFMDYLNNYGVRLLMPFSGRWFYGDAVFIVDVWLWLVLAAGIVAARKGRPGYARAAVVVACLYIAGMIVSARAARTIVADAWIAQHGAAPRALMVGPAPVSPFRKQIIVDAGDHYRQGTFTWLPRRVVFDAKITPKHAAHPAVARARDDPKVRGILAWSRFPFWEIEEGLAGETRVTVRDMRFAGIGRGGFSATAILRP